MYVVYKHVNKINGKIYIGITKQLPEQRWGSNGSNYKSSPHFYSAIEKYGWKNFEHIILYKNLSQNEACQKEIELIAQYQSNNPEFGYNNTSGGEKSFKLSQKAKEKKSKSMQGNKNGCHPCSEETKEKIRRSQIGKTLTDEHKEKLRNAAKHRKSPPCSEEKKEKLKNSYPFMRKIYCKETDTIYKSIQDCARQLGLDATAICAVCKGRHKVHKGYHFNYVDNI